MKILTRPIALLQAVRYNQELYFIFVNVNHSTLLVVHKMKGEKN